MAYGDLEGPSDPKHTVKFTAVSVPVLFTVAPSGQDADPADLDAAVQKFVDLIAGLDEYRLLSASKSGSYAQAITPTGGA